MKELRKDIKNGISKDEAFKNYLNRGGDAKKGSRYLSYIPEGQFADKYLIANNMLLSVYGVLSVMGLVALLPQLLSLPPVGIIIVLLIGLLIPGVILYLIYKKNAVGYFILAFFCLKGIVDSFRVYQEDPGSVWVGVTINLILLIFVVILKKKIFPYQNFLNVKKNENGHYLYR